MPSSRRPLEMMSSAAATVARHGGVAVMYASDQGAQPQPLGGLRQRGQRRPALQAWPAAIRKDRVEVVEGPARLVDLDVVGGLPDSKHLCPGGVLRGGFE